MGRCLFMRKGETHTAPKQGLPAGYTELEYIQSTGTQHINTGVIIGPSNYDKMKFSVTAEKIGSGSGTNTTSWMLDGASASNYSFFYIGVSNGLVYYGCGSQDINSGISYAGGKCTFTLDAKNAKVSVTGHNDISATIASVDNNVPIYLFGFYTNETAIYRHAEKIYRCQIFENDVLIRDFIPCINASGEVGLYDLVGKQFYGNAGTGVFIGSEVE